MIRALKDRIEIYIEEEKTLEEVKEKYCLSDRLFSRAYRDRRILINGEFRRKGLDLYRGDIFKLYYEDEEEDLIALDKALDILYEDDNLLIVRKESGIPTHRGKFYLDNTLENMVKYYFEETGLRRRVRFINRLDKDTEGIILIGKNPYIVQLFSSLISKGEIRRKYLAVVEGEIDELEGLIDLPIYKDGTRLKRIVDSRGKRSLTKFQTLDKREGYSLVELELITGRTHQIRLHMAHAFYPLVGDPIYGRPDRRLFLKSNEIEFIHPISKDLIQIRIDSRKDLSYNWFEDF